MPHSAIDRASWYLFCNAYSRQHQGWIGSVEAIEPAPQETGAAREEEPAPVTLADNVALQGIVLQGHQQEPELLVCMGRGTDLFTHRIARPTLIEALQTDLGLDEGLLIHDEKGGVHRIRFRVPASPDVLDGISPVP